MTFDGVRRVFADLVAPARRFTAILSLLAAALAGTVCAIAAETVNPDIAQRRAIERRTFADAEIIDGFFKVTFGAECRRSTVLSRRLFTPDGLVISPTRLPAKAWK